MTTGSAVPAPPPGPNRVGNPFTESAAGEYFVGREAEVRQFEANLEGLTSGTTAHMFVAGLHGTGKTSFLDHLGAVARGHKCLPVLTTVDPNTPALAQVKTLVQALVEGLDDWGKANESAFNFKADWKKGPDSAHFELAGADALASDVLRGDLNTLAAAAQGASLRGLVLLIDEGQRVEPDALSALKNALQQELRVLTVLSLRLPTAEGGAAAAGRALLDSKGRVAEGDFGASRLFVAAVEMGPFATDAEARRCIERRLENNVIDFDQPLVDGILRLAGRVPRSIIGYAHKVYAKAEAAGVKVADLPLLLQVVREEHANELAQASAVVADMSETARQALRTLLQCGGSASSLQVAQRWHDGSDMQLLTLLEAGVEAELDAICQRYPPLEHNEDVFRLQTEVSIFVLGLALGELQ